MIRVFVVDDDSNIRQAIGDILGLDPEFRVVGECDRVQGALEAIEKTRPHIVLLDVQLPDGEGPGLAAAIQTLPAPPGVIMISVQSDMAFVRRSMIAGAKDYISKPFSPEELSGAIRRVYEASGVNLRQKGRIVGFLGCRGGVGNTTVTLSVGAAAAKNGRRVVLVDGDLPLGDMAFLLNVRPEITWADWSTDCLGGESDVRKYLVQAPGGMELLCAPPNPAQAELVKAEAIPRALDGLREHFDLVLVDIRRSFDDLSLEMAEAVQDLCFVTDPSLSGIKNMRLLWDLMEQLRFPHEERMVLMNRVGKEDKDTVKETRKNWPELVTLSRESGIERAWLKGQTPIKELPRSPFSKQVQILAEKWNPSEGGR